MRYVLLIGFAIVIAAFACSDSGSSSGDGGSGALSNFSASECKKESAQALYASLTRALVTGVASGDYEGLKCVSWDAGADGGAKIDLINFESACGPKWQGGATVGEGNALALAVDNPGCMLAGCGSCIYDWSFAVTGLTAGKDIALVMKVNACPDDATSTNNVSYSVTIPAAATPKGIMCRYADWGALNWQVMSLGTAGQLHMPCAGLETDAGTPPCDEGLTCEKLAPGSYGDGAICLKSCTADADCPLTDLISCQSGLCKLKAQW